jgi:ectoine hydroxylase-related dioxygenase (phytanoyl-CoA dioxygenase family)
MVGMTIREQIEFFEENHYLLLPAVLTDDEIAHVNEAIDRNREHYAGSWSHGKRSQSAQCLLGMPEADFLIRHPSFFNVAQHIFDGDICFDEFSVMIREGNMEPGAQEGWHRDAMPNPDHRLGISALSAIYYLTDVDETTPRYSLVPASHDIDEPRKLNAEGEPDVLEGELDMIGPAGSVILVNSGIWHCGKWGHSPRERRTAHIYYTQSTTPPLACHTICPRRLWDVEDAEQRRFYSKFNDLTKQVVNEYR